MNSLFCPLSKVEKFRRAGLRAGRAGRERAAWGKGVHGVPLTLGSLLRCRAGPLLQHARLRADTWHRLPVACPSWPAAPAAPPLSRLPLPLLPCCPCCTSSHRPSSRAPPPTLPPCPQMDAKLVGSPIPAPRLFDCVNVILSYQNSDGGWATYENKRSFEILEVRGWLCDVRVLGRCVACVCVCRVTPLSCEVAGPCAPPPGQVPPPPPPSPPYLTPSPPPPSPPTPHLL